MARTRWRFGNQRLLVTLWACEILLPVIGPLPQISHRCAIVNPPETPDGGWIEYHTEGRKKESAGGSEAEEASELIFITQKRVKTSELVA